MVARIDFLRMIVEIVASFKRFENCTIRKMVTSILRLGHNVKHPG
jgi:hypothetical protein